MWRCVLVATILAAVHGASVKPDKVAFSAASTDSTVIRPAPDVTTAKISASSDPSQSSFVAVSTTAEPDIVDEVEEEGLNGKKIPTIRSLTINSTIRFRYSVTECISRVLNPDSKASEVTFSLTLPKSAFISNFSMEIQGKTYFALIKEKADAKETYDAAVEAGKSAAHVALNSRDSGRFSVSVNVAGKEKVKFRLIYEELLTRKVGQYEQKISLDPGQVVQELIVEANIVETRNFTKVRVPELRKGLLEETERDNPLVNITKISGNRVKITYAPTVADQKRLRDNKKGISGEFVIQYDIDHDPKGELYVADGYFVHYLTPDEKHFKTMRKHIIFIIDLSGSMYGSKLQQTKDAMKVILNDLNRKDDYISIVTFSSGAKVWSATPSETANVTVDTDPLAPQQATEDLITRAKFFVDSWEADGYTDIDSGLKLGFKQAQKNISAEENEIEPVTPIIMFLTDGVPTQGELSEARIIANAVKRNAEAGNKVHLFTLGFGEDVSFDLLKKVALKNFGFARKIYADSDATLQLTDFFKEISHPVLTDVNITYLGDSVDKNSTTKTVFSAAFVGSELVTTGKLKSGSNSIPEYVINAVSRTGPVAFNGSDAITIDPTVDDTIGAQYNNFLERLWAYQSVRRYLERLDTDSDGDNKTELRAKALDISLKFSFVTDLTSLVVVKPDEEPKLIEETPVALEQMIPASGGAFSSSAIGFSMAANVIPAQRYGGPSTLPTRTYSYAGLPGLLGLPGPGASNSISGLGFQKQFLMAPYDYEDSEDLDGDGGWPPSTPLLGSGHNGNHIRLKGVAPSALGPHFGNDPFIGYQHQAGLGHHPTTNRPVGPYPLLANYLTTTTRRPPATSPGKPEAEEESADALELAVQETTAAPKTNASRTPTDAQEASTTEEDTSNTTTARNEDVLDMWVNLWLKARDPPGALKREFDGQEAGLWDNVTYLALRVDKEPLAACEMKLTNGTGVCASVSYCALQWTSCTFEGSDPIGALTAQFQCDMNFTSKHSSKTFGWCCPGTDGPVATQDCPKLQTTIMSNGTLTGSTH